MQKLIQDFIKAINAFDVETALAFFATDAVIDDVSVGDKFVGTAGVRKYLDQFFVGYNTSTKVLSVEAVGDHRMVVRVDFTGRFGHETGVLDISLNALGQIEAIAAALD